MHLHLQSAWLLFGSLDLKPCTMPHRNASCVQAHFQPMREAVRQLPRLWQLHGQLPLAAALQGIKQAPAMAHLSTPVSSGQPLAIGQPSGHTAIPLDRDYMSLGTGEPMRHSSCESD